MLAIPNVREYIEHVGHGVDLLSSVHSSSQHTPLVCGTCFRKVPFHCRSISILKRSPVPSLCEQIGSLIYIIMCMV